MDSYFSSRGPKWISSQNETETYQLGENRIYSTVPPTTVWIIYKKSSEHHKKESTQADHRFKISLLTKVRMKKMMDGWMQAKIGHAGPAAGKVANLAPL